MAISSCPSPVDAGVLCFILANTAMSISIFKGIICSFLHTIGIHLAPCEELSVEPSHSPACRASASEWYMEDFRSRIPPMSYDSVFTSDSSNQDCSICLADFEPKAEVQRLPCSHVFHKSCLEKWVKYWNTTCPLCRNCIMPQEAEEDSCPIVYHVGNSFTCLRDVHH